MTTASTTIPLPRSIDRSIAVEPEDSYLKNYRKLPKKRYSSARAVQLSGEELELGAENVIHGKVKVPELKAVCKRYGVSITKYLAACLIDLDHILEAYQVFEEKRDNVVKYAVSVGRHWDQNRRP